MHRHARLPQIVHIAIACVLLLSAGLAAGQIVARSGVSEIHRLDSPMVLEMPFPAADPALWKNNSAVFVKEPLASYVCDNVTISNVSIGLSKPRRGVVRMKISGVLKNAPGHDKLVSVSFQVFDGDVLIGDRGFIDAADVEEGRQSVRQVALNLPEAKLREHPTAKLRVRMTVRDH